jgi:murein DD-endopeptidase MepM/ murein hydrolase activator NlpD
MTVKDRRNAIERAFMHHGIDYSPPEEGGRSTWVISTGTGRKTATTTQAEWYCQGLADKERKQAKGQ